jgi:hypothetical protein
MRREFTGENRNEDDVVDSENNFQNREGEKTDPELRVG